MILQKPTARDVFLAFCLLTLIAAALTGGCTGWRLEMGQVDPVPVLEVSTGEFSVPNVLEVSSFKVILRLPVIKMAVLSEPKPQSIFDTEVADETSEDD